MLLQHYVTVKSALTAMLTWESSIGGAVVLNPCSNYPFCAILVTPVLLLSRGRERAHPHQSTVRAEANTHAEKKFEHTVQMYCNYMNKQPNYICEASDNKRNKVASETTKHTGNNMDFI